ncbi:exopolyphosphatase PRUNE1 [Drosophila hydei]|uniref:Exopolyphosphatase PRUNE1 n=1 Tax=Drosophila hydei TaxID=7224 RepID=A0A6J1LC49_DROHY|nr:exopolyphosphatase PRUNE1 [Drosophila hydei]
MCLLRFLLQTRSTLNRYLPDKAATSTAARQTPTPTPTPEVNQRKLNLVIGNESCDLDSAVSALTLAFIYAARQKDQDFVPVLNIPRLDYPLKTEVGHMFQKCEINEQMLVFRDDLPEKLNNPDINVILVDHHVNSWAANVGEILDHRPMEKHPLVDQLPAHCVLHIEPELGSCATLVGERYLAEQEPRSAIVTQLLHATIVLDTINFSPTAKRFCARDLAMVEQLEQQQQQEPLDDGVRKRLRDQIFNELVAARADISKLTLFEVLRKDMKCLQTARHMVPMAGLPMLVRDFIELSDAEDAIRQFGCGTNLIVLLGMYVPPLKGGHVMRDLALISLTGHTQLVQRVRQGLLACAMPSLDLRQHAFESNFMGGCFLMQHNVQATRKHILPVIKRILLDLEESQHCDCDDVYFFKEKPKLGLS